MFPMEGTKIVIVRERERIKVKLTFFPTPPKAHPARTPAAPAALVASPTEGTLLVRLGVEGVESVEFVVEGGRAVSGCFTLRYVRRRNFYKRERERDSTRRTIEAVNCSHFLTNISIALKP